MSVPDGRYFLRLAASPSPLVGVDFTRPPTTPVITDGDDKIWIVKKVDGDKYTLAVEGAETPLLFAEAMGRGVVASLEGRVTQWIIGGPVGGPNTIQAPGDLIPPLVWTVREPAERKYPVTLDVLQEDPQVPENQKWYFVIPE